MPSLRQCNSLVIVLDKKLHQLSTVSSLSSTSKMKISKAPELLKKAVTVFKSKTSALRTRLLILASLRRRMAMVGAISHKIHAIMADREKARVDCDKALVLRKVKEKPVYDEIVDLSQLALFDQEDDGYPAWTHSLFNDDNCYTDEDNGDDHDVLLDAFDDEPSVIDIIRSNREVEGLEFNIDDEIDQAADMFIRRFRDRMNRSFL